jgi:hypothetical protein
MPGTQGGQVKPMMMPINDWVLLVQMLLLFILIQGVAYHVERKDLYSRLMSGSVAEYQRLKQKAESPKGRNGIRDTIQKAKRDSMIDENDE